MFSKNSKKVNQQDFDLLKVIGKGSFGKVMLVRKKVSDGALSVFLAVTLRRVKLAPRDSSPFSSCVALCFFLQSAHIHPCSKDDGAVYAMKVLRKDAIIKRRQVAHTQVNALTAPLRERWLFVVVLVCPRPCTPIIDRGCCCC